MTAAHETVSLVVTLSNLGASPALIPDHWYEGIELHALRGWKRLPAEDEPLNQFEADLLSRQFAARIVTSSAEPGGELGSMSSLEWRIAVTLSEPGDFTIVARLRETGSALDRYLFPAQRTRGALSGPVKLRVKAQLSQVEQADKLRREAQQALPGDPERADALAGRALEILPDSPSLLALQGFTRELLGKHDSAAASYRAALTLHDAGRQDPLSRSSIHGGMETYRRRLEAIEAGAPLPPWGAW